MDTLLDRLLTLPRPADQWLDYRALGFTAEEQPDLLEIMGDRALREAEYDSPQYWAPFHSARCLGQLQPKAAVQPLLLLLERRSEDDWTLGDLPKVFAAIGPEALEHLERYANDASRPLYCRMSAAEGIEKIGIQHQATRHACVAALTELLSAFDREDPSFNAIIAGGLVELQAVEAAPLIQAAFEAERMDIRHLGDWQDVQVELGLLAERITPRQPLLLEWLLPETYRPAVDAWERFLAGPKRPDSALSLLELHGFLFAVACAPDLGRPSEWLPLVFGGAIPEFDSEEEALAVTEAVMNLWECVERSVSESWGLPVGASFRNDLLANLDEDAPVSRWSRGFIRGHEWLWDIWDPYVTGDLDEEVGAILFALSFFASRSLAEGFLKELSGEGDTLEDLARKAARIWPDAAKEYASMGRAIFRSRLEAARAKPVRVPAEDRIGRNEPCPCRSGKKFKKCCGSGAA